MRFMTRSTAVIGGALAATVLASTAAIATPSSGSMPMTMGGETAPHMADMDSDAWAEMQGMMADGASIGEMHRWMAENGLPVGAMHRDMARMGMAPGAMHRNMASPAR